jgi:hypothetical protein
VNYTALTLAEVRAGLEEIARDAHTTFGGFEARLLNWRPDSTRWSVAQCFDHLLTANQLIRRGAEQALDVTVPRTVWQRLPLWPGVVGRMLIRSQGPDATRKFTAPTRARPVTSDVPVDIIQRFVDQQRDAAGWLGTLDEREIARAIMTSPFIRVVTYSVLDAWRLVVAHDRRHLDQARRVILLPGFPGSRA